MSQIHSGGTVHDENRPFDFPGGLAPWEKVWRDRQPWLRTRGYDLRSRYHPDWVPSWLGTDKPYMLCEDGLYMMVRFLLFQIVQALKCLVAGHNRRYTTLRRDSSSFEGDQHISPSV